MTEDKDPLLLDHEADGIRELDNKLPRWWVWLFYLTHHFRRGLHGAITTSLGRSATMPDAAEYQQEMKAGDALKTAAMARFEAEHSPRSSPRKTRRCSRGARRPFSRCARRATAPDGGGLVGPNLCDDYWIHGSNFVDNVTHHLERRAGQGHDHLEEHAQAERNLRGGQLHLHPARHAPAQSQAAGEPGPGQDRPE